MYSVLQLGKKYLQYYFHAKNGHGHGIHSPFVFEFVDKVLLDKNKYTEFDSIEGRRAELLKDNTVIEIEDFGAGSTILPFKTRVVKDTAKVSLKNKKYSTLLFRIIKYYDLKNIVELGTSFGITTSYMARATTGKVYTFEGAKSIAGIAVETFKRLDIFNVNLTEGDFDQTLVSKLKEIGRVDLAFIDGNHRKKPTIDYFELFKNSIEENGMMIFDDIHWSKEMEEAWEVIKKDSTVTLSIDLFFIGIVFFRKEFKVKQDFIIRF